MENTTLSTFEQLMNKLQHEGKVQVMGDKQSYEMQQHIQKEMDAFNIEKQRKAADSEKDLSQIVLTS